jgi:xylose isomerase
MLARHDRLFYIHASDNPGDGGDWDMISGSVHVWDWIELLMTLEQIGYDGWLGADLMPKVADAGGFYATNARLIDSMCRFVERVGEEKLRGLRGREGATPEMFSLLAGALAGDELRAVIQAAE